MRTLLSCLSAALTLTGASSFAQSDIVKRPVQFAKGKSGTTIRGSITGDQTVDYTLRAAAGQTMTVKLSGGSSVYHNVLPPGSTGEALFVGSRDGSRSMTTLPASGEYTIRLYQMGNAASSGKRWRRNWPISPRTNTAWITRPHVGGANRRAAARWSRPVGSINAGSNGPASSGAVRAMRP